MKYKVSELHKLCKQVSQTVIDISYRAKTGHIGSALSISDLLTVLYFSRMNVRKNDWSQSSRPINDSRDRLILSKGHAAASLYSVLFHKQIIDKKLLESFGADNGGLCEHPELGTPGVEMTSGSLGHGLAYGAGVALGLKMLNHESGIMNHEKEAKIRNIQNSQFKIHNSKPHVFVLISDGECGEGSVWEAAIFAARMKLDNLTVILDNNGWQCFGKTKDITSLSPILKKWQSFGFSTKRINGHNIGDIIKSYQSVPFEKDKPSLICAKTITGFGIPFLENTLISHYKVLTEEEYKKCRIV
jgi:transketolase